MYIGIDDTDSATRGMCTTYLAAVVTERLSSFARVRDRLLVRLNPDVEHKTRGNAALALRVETEETDRAEGVVVDAVEEHAVLDDENTNPGVAFLRGEPSEALGRQTRRTLHGYVEPDEARSVARDEGVRLRGWGNGRGMVGATAAVGATRVLDDWGSTYELLGYRPSEEWGDDRRVSWGSFREAHEATHPRTWDTVDETTGEVVAVPAAPGPVVYGLRGTLGGVWEANSYVETQDLERVAVYRTNQGTDAHIREATTDGLYEGGSFAVRGEVVEEPTTREGGHVFTRIEDDDGRVNCAAFEPTGAFRDTVRRLREGDEVVVQGSYVDGALNTEKLRVVSLDTTRLVKPTCCGRAMESAGAGQGYRCRDCGATSDSLVEETVDRELEEGWYEVPASARRHLAEPLARRRLRDEGGEGSGGDAKRETV